MVFCVAWNCSSNSRSVSSKDSVHFFNFPSEETDKKRRKIWIVRCLREETWQPGNGARLCSKHFENSEYVRSPELFSTIGFAMGRPRLKTDAVPTIFERNPSDCARKTPAVERSAVRKRQRHSVRKCHTNQLKLLGSL